MKKWFIVLFSWYFIFTLREYHGPGPSQFGPFYSGNDCARVQQYLKDYYPYGTYSECWSDQEIPAENPSTERAPWQKPQ